jgi:Helix-turn-helix
VSSAFTILALATPASADDRGWPFTTLTGANEVNAQGVPNQGWSQTQLAKASGMTQSAVARFEAGGTVPTLLVWNGWRRRWM